MIKRRTFLGAAAAAGLTVLPSARTAFSFAANERIGLAVMGHMYVADHFFTSVHAYPGVELVALCNPDQRRVPEIWKKWEGQKQDVYARLLADRPPVHFDFRRMLAEVKGIDAMVVSMFEHQHGPACGLAMRMGKHVFCERPLGLTISESRALRDLAIRQKVATSMRNPGNASGPFRRGVELLREGVLGEVKEVHVWFDRGGPDLKEGPKEMQAVPPGLDWDLWLGPVKWREYHPSWMAYATWRETSNGGVGTFGPHAANLAFAGLNVHDLWQGGAGRIKAKAETSGINRLSFPRWERVTYTVPAKAGEVKFTWHNGREFGPPGGKERLLKLMTDRGASPEEAVKLLGYAGAVVVGSKGILCTDDHNVKVTLLPKSDFAGVRVDRPTTIKPSDGHYNDWFGAIRGGAPAWADFTYANALGEFVMLANVATQFEAELEYDPAAGRFVGHDGANGCLGYEYRKGWAI